MSKLFQDIASAQPRRVRMRHGVALLALLSASTVAFAQPGKMFERMDGNGDGMIDADEARAARAQMFDRMDADGDGTVTREEIEQRRRRAHQFADRMFSKADDNADGRLTREEFLAAPGMLQHADSDGDGAVSAEEAAAMRERMQAKRQNRKGHEGP